MFWERSLNLKKDPLRRYRLVLMHTHVNYIEVDREKKHNLSTLLSVHLRRLRWLHHCGTGVGGFLDLDQPKLMRYSQH